MNENKNTKHVRTMSVEEAVEMFLDDNPDQQYETLRRKIGCMSREGHLSEAIPGKAEIIAMMERIKNPPVIEAEVVSFPNGEAVVEVAVIEKKEPEQVEGRLPQEILLAWVRYKDAHRPEFHCFFWWPIERIVTDILAINPELDSKKLASVIKWDRDFHSADYKPFLRAQEWVRKWFEDNPNDIYSLSSEPVLTRRMTEALRETKERIQTRMVLVALSEMYSQKSAEIADMRMRAEQLFRQWYEQYPDRKFELVSTKDKLPGSLHRIVPREIPIFLVRELAAQEYDAQASEIERTIEAARKFTEEWFTKHPEDLFEFRGDLWFVPRSMADEGIGFPLSVLKREVEKYRLSKKTEIDRVKALAADYAVSYWNEIERRKKEEPGFRFSKEENWKIAREINAKKLRFQRETVPARVLERAIAAADPKYLK